MVTFQTQQIKKYAKTLQSSIGKEDHYSECFLLDFENNKIQFKSDTDDETGQVYYGHLKVGFKGQHEKFWVDAVTFLHLCRSYDEIKVDNFVFEAVSTGEKFELKRVDSDEYDESDSYDFYDFTFETADKLSYNLISTLSTAMEFTNPDYNFPNVYVDEGIVYAGDSIIYTERKVDWELGSVQFSPVITKLLNGLMTANSEIRIGFDEDVVYLSADGEVEIIAGYIVSDNKIDYENENFRNVFMHNNIVKIEKSRIMNVLKFLEPFMRDSDNKISITLVDNKMIIKPEIAGYKAEKTISDVEYDESLEGKSFNMISEPVKKALGSLHSNKVLIRISVDVFDDEGKELKLPVSFQTVDEKELVVVPVAI